MAVPTKFDSFFDKSGRFKIGVVVKPIIYILPFRSVSLVFHDDCVCVIAIFDDDSSVILDFVNNKMTSGLINTHVPELVVSTVRLEVHL